MFLSFEGETNDSGFFSLSVLSGRKHIFKSPSVPDLEKAPAELVDRTTNNMCFFSLHGHMPREESVIKEAEKKIRDGKKSREGSIQARCGSRQQGGWVPVFPAGHLLKSLLCWAAGSLHTAPCPAQRPVGRLTHKCSILTLHRTLGVRNTLMFSISSQAVLSGMSV